MVENRVCVWRAGQGRQPRQRWRESASLDAHVKRRHAQTSQLDLDSQDSRFSRTGEGPGGGGRRQGAAVRTGRGCVLRSRLKRKASGQGPHPALRATFSRTGEGDARPGLRLAELHPRPSASLNSRSAKSLCASERRSRRAEEGVQIKPAERSGGNAVDQIGKERPFFLEDFGDALLDTIRAN